MAIRTYKAAGFNPVSIQNDLAAPEQRMDKMIGALDRMKAEEAAVKERDKKQRETRKRLEFLAKGMGLPGGEVASKSASELEGWVQGILNKSRMDADDAARAASERTGQLNTIKAGHEMARMARQEQDIQRQAQERGRAAVAMLESVPGSKLTPDQLQFYTNLKTRTPKLTEEEYKRLTRGLVPSKVEVHDIGPYGKGVTVDGRWAGSVRAPGTGTPPSPSSENKKWEELQDAIRDGNVDKARYLASQMVERDDLGELSNDDKQFVSQQVAKAKKVADKKKEKEGLKNRVAAALRILRNPNATAEQMEEANDFVTKHQAVADEIRGEEGR